MTRARVTYDDEWLTSLAKLAKVNTDRRVVTATTFASELVQWAEKLGGVQTREQLRSIVAVALDAGLRADLVSDPGMGTGGRVMRCVRRRKPVPKSFLTTAYANFRTAPPKPTPKPPKRDRDAHEALHGETGYASSSFRDLIGRAVPVAEGERLSLAWNARADYIYAARHPAEFDKLLRNSRSLAQMGFNELRIYDAPTNGAPPRPPDVATSRSFFLLDEDEVPKLVDPAIRRQSRRANERMARLLHDMEPGRAYRTAGLSNVLKAAGIDACVTSALNYAKRLALAGDVIQRRDTAGHIFLKPKILTLDPDQARELVRKVLPPAPPRRSWLRRMFGGGR